MKKSILVICALFSLSACSLFPPPYKAPVTQGNLITKDQLSQLKVGMTQSQVIYLLGTPMVRDSFKPSEWHYIYKVEYAAPETPKSAVSNLTLMFKGNNLAEIKND
ncbi:outer membrane protein assembly factor BamE [Marinomonas flavescens]|uniref:outer membrane protein assembly factor BamE n=1 Tax=Marinomonas flavescens TaxID=2529379 RepID=UPI001054859F|nr:outer membrane protein assembly factor BamE [Marinomonas flavescens]